MNTQVRRLLSLPRIAMTDSLWHSGNCNKRVTSVPALSLRCGQGKRLRTNLLR